MILVGKSASSGIVVGRALLLKQEALVVEETRVDNTDVEIARFRRSIEKSKTDLGTVRENALATMGADKAAIFDAHLLVLEDPELIDETERIIRDDKLNASAAFRKVSQNFIVIFDAMENEYMRERAADIRDISDRVLRNLAGHNVMDLSTLTDEHIVVCHDLTPSETATLNPQKVLGILADIGGKTGHTAIMARTLEIPAVLGLRKITQLVRNGDWIAFNGETGEVVINPDEKTREMHLQARARELQDKIELQKLIGLPNQTLDGHTVGLLGNIGSIQDLGVLKKYDARGVGLYRTEFLFMDHAQMPTEQEQFVAYKAVLEALPSLPVTIRTLDIGGDKAVPYLDMGKEENPFLGYRAIRYCLEHPEVFRPQLRALLRASVYGNLRIMFPMISSLDELLAAKEAVASVRAELVTEGVSVANDLPLGVMIEIPSAAIISDVLAQHCEFMSIGTNDLIQYVVAVDRQNERVQNLYDPFHPGVLRLIATVIENGHKYGRKVSMCGEMGGSELHLPLLLGLGLDEFSMAPTYVLRARRQLRQWTIIEARKLSQDVLKRSRSAEIEALLTEARNQNAKAKRSSL